jgi:(1->4)-alpha-D-glucan 1-alpha-D-glucosylmutase
MNALLRLAELAGILPEYHDIWGQRHETTDAARRALLAAMGLRCASGAETEATLRAWEKRMWLQRLPPVQVATVGMPLRITLRLPARATGQALQWHLLLENGGHRDGHFVPDKLVQMESSRVAGQTWRACALDLPAVDATGYHRLEVWGEGEETGDRAAMALIVCPGRCYQPEAIQGDNRVWGLSLQLYGVRSGRNWGMGDFTDLRHLVEWAANAGAGLVGVNPLHALFPHNPAHASPYSPSSRRFLNVLYVDVEAVPEFAECAEARQRVATPEFQARLRALRAESLVDYAGVAAAKFDILERLYRHFRAHHLATESERGRAFRAWRAGGGEDLERFARYHALQEHLHAQDPELWGWPVWPQPYRDPESAEVAVFAAAHEERVTYFLYQQWLADAQLDHVGWRSMELGLGVGLYQDLAVGEDLGGAETWSRQALYAADARIGSPPDDFNLFGQDWGMPPWVPQRLREAAYAPFIAMLRANMRCAGALRLDHVMGLMRLYWVPPGMRADQGAYVAYPFGDLLGILALESQRNRCLVVGEDLGTVPEAVREAMHALGMLSYRLFYFERGEDGAFKPPGHYPQAALVAASTHDLPTLAGFWRGLDLDLRAQLGLFPDEAQRSRQVVARAEDRARLLVALERDNLLPEGVGVHPVSVPEMSPALARALHRYLARTPAKIALVQAEDMLGELDQVNLPGTTEAHPNWRHKLSLNLEAWAGDARIDSLAAAMTAERGRAVLPRAAPPFPQRALAAPRATYRLQLHHEFGFAAARALVPYLVQLGISHCYCSPYFKARPGSPHGYDIIDHNSLNPEIGDEAEFEAFCDALAANGMGQILDLVPNHMGIMGADNAWWLEVLEDGEASPYADFFDIDWSPLKTAFRGKVLVPVLGDHYGDVLERGELRLTYDEKHDDAAAGFSVWYFEHRFPIDPRTYPSILNLRLEALGARLGADSPAFIEYQSLATAFSHLPARDALAPEQMAERSRDKETHKRHLAHLFAATPDIAQFVRENVAIINGRAGEPGSFDALHALLSAQAYRLAYWRVASDEINYRRFFDVNDLAALRMERETVFAATHRLVFQLLQRGWLAGLRIDHADGLFAPAEYFERLQRLHAEARPMAREGLYVVVEKILAAHEHLPEDWAVAGSTGYDAANMVNGLCVDEAAAERLHRVWRLFTRQRAGFDEVLYQSKLVIMETALASELNVLAIRLARIAEMDRHTRDYTLNSLRGALLEIVASFPVYRTYIGGERVSEEDRRHIEWACAAARKRVGLADTGVFDFVRDLLVGMAAEGKEPAYRRAVLDFGMRLQQFTSPVMAKGMEDTAFYRHHPLASLNEVGGDPRRFGVSVGAFHHANQERARHHPHGLVAGSTHDSKRGEDVRARLDVLSEMPERWRLQLGRWHRLNRTRFAVLDGAQVPSRHDEYLLYQTLLGTWPEVTAAQARSDAAWPGYVQRIGAYMIKAVREAKEASSWVHPNAAYEAPLQEFITAILEPRGNARFLQDFAPFAAEVAHFGRINSLAQTLLRLTVPGVPDIYQGSELWHLALVDPDNRRAVDYELRRRLLDELCAREQREDPAALCHSLLDEARSGAVKLHVIRKVLQLRKERNALFSHGEYLPLGVEGGRATHVCAFARRYQGTAAVVIVPRLPYTLLAGKPAWPAGEGVWQDTSVRLAVAGRSWRNLFTGERITLSRRSDRLVMHQAMASFPLALLIPETTAR